MGTRILLMSIMIAAFPCVLAAQEAPSGTATVDVSTELKSIREQLKTLAGNVTDLTTQVGENATQIGQLRSELQTLKDQINEELLKQQQILAAISETDSEGRHVPRLSAAMESQQFRQEMKKVIHDSLDRSGTFIIRNKTNQYQTISVNRVQYGIGPGESLTLQVPVGTVSTQLPGKELKNWTVAAPSYQQTIEIVPTSAPVVTNYAPSPLTPAPVTDPLLWYPGYVYVWP